MYGHADAKLREPVDYPIDSRESMKRLASANNVGPNRQKPNRGSDEAGIS